MKAPTVVATVFAVLTALCLPAAKAAPAFDPAPYVRPQRLVNIGGGRRLNVYCTGAGFPTVVLEAGLGDSIESWSDVLPSIARHSRVCAYDRAGMGFSDGTVWHRDANGVADDLHALVRRAGISPPFVLVGHSIAGLYARAYTDRYPRDVAGLVLVDPSSPYQDREFVAIAPAIEKFISGSLRCLQEQSNGRLVVGTAEGKRCQITSAAEFQAQCRKDGAARCALDRFDFEHQLGLVYARTLLAETERFYDDTSSREVVREQRDYRALPLIVLTAVNQSFTAIPGVTSNQAHDISAAWTRMHDRIAALSTSGVNFLIAPSGHYIQHEHPAAVVSAVDEIVDRVRYRSRRARPGAASHEAAPERKSR